MIDSYPQFRDAIRTTGLEPPVEIEPGKLHRFPGIGKPNGNTAAWCRLFNDGLGGCFGDWSSGFSENWQAKRDKSCAPRAVVKRHVAKERAQAERDRIAIHVEAAKKASVIWNAAPNAASNHPYLIRKGISVNGARLHRGALTLAIRDFTDQLTSLQFIQPDGTKRLQKGGLKKGCFIHVAGDLVSASRVIICEGWATGCTLAADDPKALILSAVDAGNLKAVALSARCRWIRAELIIAGDDDQLAAVNPGKNKAHAAAIASNAMLALPQWPEGVPETLTDFNDLAAWLSRGAL